jgi:hypothetical protein
VRFDDRLGWPSLLQVGAGQDHTGFEVREFEITSPPAPCPAPQAFARQLEVPTRDLLALWRFDDCQDPRVEDASVEGHHGSVRHGRSPTAIARSAGPWRPGLRGGAVSLNENVNEDWIRIEPRPAMARIAETNVLTIAAWVRPASSSSDQVLVSRRDHGANQVSFALGLSGGHPVCRIGGTKLYANEAAPLRAWSHVAMTFDGGTCALYLDGVLVRSGAAPGPLTVQDGPLLLGAEEDGTSVRPAFSGRLDDVTVHARALSASEIDQLARRPH